MNSLVSINGLAGLQGPVGVGALSAPYSVPGLIFQLKPTSTTLFQDTGRTTPAVLNGATVESANSVVGSAFGVITTGQATLALNALGATPAIRFSGFSNTAGMTLTNFALTNRQAYTSFLAHRCTTRGRLGLSSSGICELNSGSYQWISTGVYTGNVTSQLANPVTDQQEVCTTISQASGVNQRQNGVLTFTGATPWAPGSVSAASLFGFFDNASYPYSGDVYEMLWYNRILNSTEIGLVEAYLQAECPIYVPSPTLPLFCCDGNSLMVGVGASTNLNQVPDLALATLGAGYNRVNFAIGGFTTPQLTASAGTRVDPYYLAGRAKNICPFWEITNDILAGSTGAQAYANVQTYGNARKAVGWKVILLDCLPRSAFSGAQTTQAGICNASLAADFTGTTSSPYVFTPAGGVTYADALVRVSQIPSLSNPANTTYYIDGTHLNDTGNALVATPFVVAVQLF